MNQMQKHRAYFPVNTNAKGKGAGKYNCGHEAKESVNDRKSGETHRNRSVSKALEKSSSMQDALEHFHVRAILLSRIRA